MISRQLRWSAVAVVLAAVVTGCGVPLDSSPRAINVTTTSVPASTTAGSQSTTGNVVRLYYFKGDALSARKVSVDKEPTVQNALETLFTTKAPTGLVTYIPAGAELLSVTAKDGRVSIDLGAEMKALTGNTERIAYAQMVFTALAFPEYTEVTFSIEGTPVAAPTDDGNQSVVLAGYYDYPVNKN